MQNKNMKKMIVILVLGALSVCLVPAVAQVQDWEVSTMQGSGSAYSSQVTPVGASSAPDEATVGNGVPANRPGPYHSFGDNQDGGTTSDPSSPIGDGVLPLLLLSAMAGGVIFLRRRKQMAQA